jgi:hypothetical protein
VGIAGARISRGVGVKKMGVNYPLYKITSVRLSV